MFTYSSSNIKPFALGFIEPQPDIHPFPAPSTLLTTIDSVHSLHARSQPTRLQQLLSRGIPQACRPDYMFLSVSRNIGRPALATDATSPSAPDKASHTRCVCKLQCKTLVAHRTRTFFAPAEPPRQQENAPGRHVKTPSHITQSSSALARPAAEPHLKPR